MNSESENFGTQLELNFEEAEHVLSSSLSANELVTAGPPQTHVGRQFKRILTLIHSSDTVSTDQQELADRQLIIAQAVSEARKLSW